MRLVAWNANYNNRKRRTFAENINLLSRFHPDVMVVSETALPNEPNPDAVVVGKESPALVVAVRKGYRISPSPRNGGAPTLAGVFDILGPVSFRMVALWPVQRNGQAYHRILNETLDWFKDELQEPPAILAGDLNSNTRVSGQSHSHPRLVTRLRSLGLESVYHHHSGEHHGDETIATFVQGKKRPRRFHIDYCFVRPASLPAATLTIPQAKEWMKCSDHFPLVLDIPDVVLGSTATRR